MKRFEIYQYIISNLEETYKKKNKDYGNSVGDTFEKFGDISFLTRITDKYNRILSLVDKGECGEVKDEAIEDTILDLANYCLLWLVEREYKKQGDLASQQPEIDLTLQSNKPASNYGKVDASIMNDVQSWLTKLKPAEFRGVIKLLEGHNVPYEIRTNGYNNNKVKLVLVVEDIVILQKIMNNLGI